MPLVADPQVLDWIAAVEAATPPSDASAAGQRASYDAMCAVFRAARPAGVAVGEDRLDTPAGPLPRRHYTPAGAGPVRVVYFHGGGHVVGGLDSHDDVCAELAAATGCPVSSIDYRLAPEHTHPAGAEDAEAAARAALARGPAILAGDSAGGTLAAVAALALGGAPGLLGQVLIYPGLGGEALGLPSYADCAEAPLLRTADLAGYRSLRAGGPVPRGDWRFDPLAAPPDRLAKAPPAWITVADVDPLRDDGPEYARRLSAAGVAATCVVEPELPHMWLRARHHADRAAAAFARLCAAVAGFAAGVSAR